MFQAWVVKCSLTSDLGCAKKSLGTTAIESVINFRVRLKDVHCENNEYFLVKYSN